MDCPVNSLSVNYNTLNTYKRSQGVVKSVSKTFKRFISDLFSIFLLNTLF